VDEKVSRNHRFRKVRLDEGAGESHVDAGSPCLIGKRLPGWPIAGDHEIRTLGPRELSQGRDQ
jgi:hypothetical protein